MKRSAGCVLPLWQHPRSPAAALELTLQSYEHWIDELCGLLAGRPASAVPAAAVREARRRLRATFGAAICEEPPAGLCPQVLSAWQQAAQDPDSALPRWAADGSPLGIAQDIDRCGVFLPVEESGVTEF